MDEQHENYWLENATTATALRRALAEPDADAHTVYSHLPIGTRNVLIDIVRAMESALWTAYVEAKYRAARAALDAAERERQR